MAPKIFVRDTLRICKRNHFSFYFSDILIFDRGDRICKIVQIGTNPILFLLQMRREPRTKILGVIRESEFSFFFL